LQTSKTHHDDDACKQPRQPRTGCDDGMEAVAKQQQCSQHHQAQCSQDGLGGHQQGQTCRLGTSCTSLVCLWPHQLLQPCWNVRLCSLHKSLHKVLQSQTAYQGNLLRIEMCTAAESWLETDVPALYPAVPHSSNLFSYF